MSENDCYDYYEERGDKKPGILGRLKKAYRKAKAYYEENTDFCNIMAFCASAVVGIAGVVIDGTRKSMNLRKEEELKNLYVYDRRLGHYWKLRRSLSNSQWLMINEAMARGESMGNVLERMNVLAKK